MNRLLKYIFSFLILFICLNSFGQKNNKITEVEIRTNKNENYSRYIITFNNESDSLLCILFSGSQGTHNTKRFELPLVDTEENYDIFKLTVAESDKYIDSQCRYLQMLTIKPHSKKSIDIYIKRTNQPIKIILEYAKLLRKEKKFLKRIKNKNCLGKRFEFKTTEITID